MQDIKKSNTETTREDIKTDNLTDDRKLIQNIIRSKRKKLRIRK